MLVPLNLGGLGATICQMVFNYDTSDYDYNCYDDGTADPSTRELPESGPWRPPTSWNPTAPVFTVVDDPNTGQPVTAFVDQQTGQVIPPAQLTQPAPIIINAAPPETPAPVAPATPAAPTPAAAAPLNFLTKPVTIAGLHVPMWELLAAGALGAVLLKKKRKNKP